MDMPHLSLFLSFSAQIRKKVEADLMIVTVRPPARKHHMWYESQRVETLYVVFRGQIVTLFPAALDGALLLFTPWYTSGNSAYGRKSDHPAAVIR